MISSLFISLISISNNYVHNPIHEHTINSSLSIDYFQECESIEGVNQLNSVFLNGFNSDFIIDNFEGNQSQCELSCNFNDNCRGYVWYQNESEWCNTLTNISGVGQTNLTSQSYQKVLFHHLWMSL